jgi:predicted regulator of Ras-like GTPase activity (Roadblock/LC7/MglB family)
VIDEKMQAQAERNGLVQVPPENVKDMLERLIYEFKQFGDFHFALGGKDDYQVLIQVGRDEIMAPLVAQAIVLHEQSIQGRTAQERIKS